MYVLPLFLQMHPKQEELMIFSPLKLLAPTEIQLSLGQATRAILAPSAVSDAFCPIVNGVESLLFKLIPILEKVVNLFANNPNSKEASQVTSKSSLEFLN